jgi:hypothetical protein
MPLRVYNGEATTPADAAESDPPPPMPIQCRPFPMPDGGTAVFAIWFNDEGERCRACPPGTCTFMPTVAGVGTCIHNAEGGLRRTVPLPAAAGH